MTSPKVFLVLLLGKVTEFIRNYYQVNFFIYDQSSGIETNKSNKPNRKQESEKIDKLCLVLAVASF